VYVSVKDHIEAHFLTCYIALVILRLLQLSTGLSCAAIKNEISAMNGTNIAANWWIFDHRTDNSDLIAERLGLKDLMKQNITTKQASEILSKASKLKIPYVK
jgi:hypothetical protein